MHLGSFSESVQGFGWILATVEQFKHPLCRVQPHVFWTVLRNPEPLQQKVPRTRALELREVGLLEAMS